MKWLILLTVISKYTLTIYFILTFFLFLSEHQEESNWSMFTLNPDLQNKELTYSRTTRIQCLLHQTSQNGMLHSHHSQWLCQDPNSLILLLGYFLFWLQGFCRSHLQTQSWELADSPWGKLELCILAGNGLFHLLFWVTLSYPFFHLKSCIW